jgi:hypothetical protein
LCGTYNTWRGGAIEIIDARDASCPHRWHENNTVLASAAMEQD